MLFYIKAYLCEQEANLYEGEQTVTFFFSQKRIYCRITIAYAKF